jgi:hypothetical protein
MNNVIRFIAAFAFASTALLSATAANAACNSGWVKVTYVYEGTSAAGTPYAYIYSVPEHSLLPTTSYYFFTADTTAILHATAAQQNHESVYMNGNAATCPTVGSYLYGGTLLYIYNY